MRNKKKYHHGNLEDALLSAGFREARIRGPRNLGVNFLAKAVDVSPAAVYRHFVSGESLRANISQQAREELARRMLTAIARQTDVKQRFLAVGRVYIDFALTDPGLFAVAFVACDEPPKRDDNPSAWTVFQDAILDLCSAGLINPSALEQVASFAWATVHGYATLASGSDPMRPQSDDQSIADCLERTWSGIIHHGMES